MAGDSARGVAHPPLETSEGPVRHAESEAWTAAVLGTLPAGWTIVHDVRWPGRSVANTDHVVVGPGGIFVIDSKNCSGTVAVEEGVLRQNGRAEDTAVDACAASVRAVGEYASELGLPVSGILCLVRDEHLAVVSRGVMVCTTRNLGQILRSCPVVLTSRRVSTVASALEERMQPGPRPAAVAAWPAVVPAGVGAGAAAEPATSPAAGGGAGAGPVDGPVDGPVGVPPAPGAAGPAHAGTAEAHADEETAPHRVKKPRRARNPRQTKERAAERPRLVRLVLGTALLVSLIFSGPDLVTRVGPVVSDQITRLLADSGACPSPATPAAQSTPAPRATHAGEANGSKHQTRKGKAGRAAARAKAKRARATSPKVTGAKRAQTPAEAAEALTPC